MIIEYCQKTVGKAKYRELDDGTWFAEIDRFEGVWGNGVTVEECRNDLISALEEWLILKLQDGDELPVVDDLEIKVSEVAEV